MTANKLGNQVNHKVIEVDRGNDGQGKKITKFKVVDLQLVDILADEFDSKEDAEAAYAIHLDGLSKQQPVRQSNISAATIVDKVARRLANKSSVKEVTISERKSNLPK